MVAAAAAAEEEEDGTTATAAVGVVATVAARTAAATAAAALRGDTDGNTSRRARGCTSSLQFRTPFLRPCHGFWAVGA